MFKVFPGYCFACICFGTVSLHECVSFEGEMNAVQLQPLPIDRTFNICWLCLCAVLEGFMAKLRTLAAEKFCWWDFSAFEADILGWQRVWWECSMNPQKLIHRSKWRARIVLFDLKIYIYLSKCFTSMFFYCNNLSGTQMKRLWNACLTWHPLEGIPFHECLFSESQLAWYP